MILATLMTFRTLTLRVKNLSGYLDCSLNECTDSRLGSAPYMTKWVALHLSNPTSVGGYLHGVHIYHSANASVGRLPLS